MIRLIRRWYYKEKLGNLWRDYYFGYITSSEYLKKANYFMQKIHENGGYYDNKRTN